MDVWHIYSRRLGIWIKEKGKILSDGETIEHGIKEMYAEASRDMRGEGFSDDQVNYLVELFLSRGEDVPEGRVVLKGLNWKEALKETLEAQTPKLAVAPDVLASVMFLHATATIPHFAIQTLDLSGDDPGAGLIGTRPVCWEKGAGLLDTPIYDRARLKAGNTVRGPAVVEAADTTYVVRDNWTYRIDQYGNGIFEEVTA